MVAAANVEHSKYQCGFTPPSGPHDCNNPFFFFALVGDAVMQVTGVALLASGVVFRRKVWVRNPGFTLVPTIRVTNGPHVGISGTFWVTLRFDRERTKKIPRYPTSAHEAFSTTPPKKIPRLLVWRELPTSLPSS